MISEQDFRWSHSCSIDSPSIKYIYCTDSILDMTDETTQRITVEAMGLKKNSSSYPSQKATTSQKTSVTSYSPAKSENRGNAMDSEKPR